MDPSLAPKTGKQTLSDESPIPKSVSCGEFWPLTGKPYFNIVLKDVHVTKKRLIVPNRISKYLPNVRVPARILCHGNVWETVYLGHYQAANRMFENRSWGKFVKDNNLTVGDACVFELMEGDSKSTRIQFRVQILKDDFPSELLKKAEGFAMNNPISID